MIIISHRGNINGPEPQKENLPDYIDFALENGLDVEVDLWWNKGIYLGHIWVNDMIVKPPQNCVVPLLGLEDIHNYKFKDAAFAICTDYPLELL